MDAPPTPRSLILRAYRVRLVPTVEQRKALGRAAGTARAAYNWALAEWRREYRAYQLAVKAPARAKSLLMRWGSALAVDERWSDPPGPKPSAFSMHKRLNAVKGEKMPWIDEAPSHAVREAVLDVGEAYGHFFRRLKEGKMGRAAGEPRFRSRHGRRGFHMDEGKALAIRPGAVRLQKIGWVRVHPHQAKYLPAAEYDPKTRTWKGAKICGIGLSEHLGAWYAAVRVEIEAPRPKRPREPGKKLGVEVGVRSLVVTSEGVHVGALRDLEKMASADRRLALWSRRLSRRFKKGAKEQSARWQEAKGHVQRIHAEIARARDELLHYAANRVIDSGAELIKMREPAVQSMIGRAGKRGEAARKRNALAPMVSRVGWYELRRKVEYKQRWAGGEFLQVPAAIESTRLCSACGALRDSDPGYPDFRCPHCGHHMDREANSARILRDYEPPSGGPVDPGRTGRGKGARKRVTTAERTAKPGALGQPGTDGADGDVTSPPGSGKEASASADGTDVVSHDPTPAVRELTARVAVPIGERQGDVEVDTQAIREARHGAELPEANRSQSDRQVRGRTE